MMNRKLNLRERSTTNSNMYGRFCLAFALCALLAWSKSCLAFAQFDEAPASIAALAAAPTLAVFADNTVVALPDLRNINPEGDRGAGLTADVDLPDVSNNGPVAPIYTKYILAGITAQPINARDKLLIGLRDLYTPFAFGGFFTAAAYGHILNGQPNYGTDRGAFGARLGAAVIGATAQGILTDTIFAPLLHEDPRYYIEGPRYGLVHRAVYAATRPLVTRTDRGRRSANGALLLGYAAATALSLTYYPQSNRNFHDAIATFGGSIGGESLDFLLREFSSDVLTKLHLVTQE